MTIGSKQPPNRPAARLVLAFGLSAVMAGVAVGQQQLPGREFQGGFGRQRMPREQANLDPGQVPYDGRFTFARLRYQMGPFGGGLGEEGFFRRRGGWREPPWSHDYPRAERNFMKILKEISTIDPFMGPEGGNIVDIGSPELFKFPLAYMSEPGFWTQTDQEAENLRRYLQKGGFLIFDDFRGDDWVNFEEQMMRVLPGARLVELDVTSPIFHSFFEIESLDFRQYYDRGEALFYGIFEDNDPKKRLLVIANYNNDIGEYWEFSDTGWTPIDLSNEAYKFGVNYVVYGMTH